MREWARWVEGSEEAEEAEEAEELRRLRRLRRLRSSGAQEQELTRQPEFRVSFGAWGFGFRVSGFGLRVEA